MLRFVPRRHLDVLPSTRPRLRPTLKPALGTAPRKLVISVRVGVDLVVEVDVDFDGDGDLDVAAHALTLRSSWSTSRSPRYTSRR